MKTKLLKIVKMIMVLAIVLQSPAWSLQDEVAANKENISKLVELLRQTEKKEGIDLSSDIAKLESGDAAKINEVIAKFSADKNKNNSKHDLKALLEQRSKMACVQKEMDCKASPCCAGLICVPNQGLTVFKIGKTGQYCGNFKAKCKEDDECCSRKCGKVDEKTGYGQCQLVEQCLPLIKKGEECISRKTHCEEGRCLPHDLDPFRIGACQPFGVECTKNDDCCSEKCDNNLCVNVYRCEKCTPAGSKIDKSNNDKCCDGYYENEDGFCRPNIPPLPPITSSFFERVLGLFISSVHADDSEPTGEAPTTCPSTSCQYGVKASRTEIVETLTCEIVTCYTREEVEASCAENGPSYHYRDLLSGCFNEKDYCEKLIALYANESPYKEEPMAYMAKYDLEKDKCLTNQEACEDPKVVPPRRWCYTIKDGRHDNGDSCQRPVLNINGRDRCVTSKFDEKRDKTTWKMDNSEETKSKVGGNLRTVTASIALQRSNPDQCRFNTKADTLDLMTSSERHYYYMLLGFEFIAGNPNGLRDYYRQELKLWDSLAAAQTGSVYDHVGGNTGALLSKTLSPHKKDNPELSIKGRLFAVASDMKRKRLDLELKMVAMDRQVTCDCVAIRGYDNVPEDIQQWFKGTVTATDFLYGRLPLGNKEAVKSIEGSPNCENAGSELQSKTGGDQAYTASLKFYPMLLNYYIAKRKMLQAFLEGNAGFSSRMLPIANYLGIQKDGKLVHHGGKEDDFLEDGPWGVVKEQEQWGFNHDYVDEQHPDYPFPDCWVEAGLNAIGTAILAVFAFVFEVLIGVMMFIPNIFSMVGGDGALFNSGDIFNAFFYGGKDPTCRETSRRKDGPGCGWGLRCQRCDGWPHWDVCNCAWKPANYAKYKIYECEGYGDSPFCSAQIPPKMCVMSAYSVSPAVGLLAGLTIPDEEYMDCRTVESTSTNDETGETTTSSQEICDVPMTRPGQGWLVDPFIPEGADGNEATQIDAAQRWIEKSDPPKNAVTQARIDKVKELSLKFINENRVFLNTDLPATLEAATSTKAGEAFSMANRMADHIVNYHFLYPSINVKYPSNPAGGFISYVDMIIYSMDSYVRSSVNKKSLEEDDLRFKTLLQSYQDACEKFGGDKNVVDSVVRQGNENLSSAGSASMNMLKEKDNDAANPCASEKGKFKPEYIRRSMVLASEGLKRFVGEGISPEYAEFATAGDVLGLGATGDAGFSGADLTGYEKAGQNSAARNRQRTKTFNHYVNTVGKTPIGKKFIEARSKFVNKMTSTNSDSNLGDKFYNKANYSSSSRSSGNSNSKSDSNAALKGAGVEITTAKKNILEVDSVASASTATADEMEIDLSDINLDDLGLGGAELSFGKGENAQTYLEMVNGLSKDKKKYQSTELDGLFEIVSKAYLRSIPKLLVKKKKPKTVEESAPTKDEDSKKSDIKKLLNNL